MTRADESLLAALNPLLDRALELAPVERLAWLDRLRETEPRLAAEVERLLDGEHRLAGRGFLESDEQGGAFKPDLPMPSQLGAYTLERPLGSGGMGSVWLGRRSDGQFEGLVAIKLMGSALLHPMARERFRREGTALARLTHPNIARLLDAGVTEAGQPYLVLEYVDGVRIDQYCDGLALPPIRRLELFRQVLDAVAHAHANLIVHRDIKPSNILVTPDGTTKLLDFGIAKLLADETGPAERTELTEAGGLPFTPEYAAPEQVTDGPITVATDVYALGVLLYLLLSGRHPTGSGLTTTAEHLRAVVEREPASLSTAITPEAAAARDMTPGRLRRLLHGDLDRILKKVLQKRPGDRYQAASALADDLGHFLRHEPVEARSPSVRYRVTKFMRRNRTLVAAAGVSVLALASAAVVSSAQMFEARRQRQVAIRQRDEARAQRDRAVFHERRASASSGFMQSLLSSIAPSTEPFRTVDLLERARLLLEQDYRGDPRFVARMLVELADHYSVLARQDMVGRLHQRARELALASGDAETQALVACASAAEWQYTEGTDSIARELSLASQVLAASHSAEVPTRVQCLVAQSHLARRTQPDSARAYGARAIRLAESAGDTASMIFVRALENQARLADSRGSRRASLLNYHRMRVLLSLIGRTGTVATLNAMMGEALAFAHLGEFTAADSAFRALEALSDRVDPFYRERFVTLPRAGLAEALGFPDSAVALLQPGLAEARRTNDRDRLRYTLVVMVGPLAESGRVTEARAQLAEGAALFPAGWELVQLQAARLAQATGRPARALRLYRAVLGSASLASPGEKERWHRITYRAAESALTAGELATADSLARLTIELEIAMGHDSTRRADLGKAYLLLARSATRRADTADALRSLSRALPALEHGAGKGHPATRAARTLSAWLAP